MRLTIDAKALAAALGQCATAIDSRPNRPILVSFLIEATGDRLKITGASDALSITRTLDAAIEREGSVCVPEKCLRDLVSRLSGELTLEVDTAGLSPSLAITASTGNYSLNALPAEDYPSLDDLEGAAEFTLSAEVLSQGMSFCGPFASDDASKYVLNGINLAIDSDQLTFASTDGHRLAIRPVAVSEPGSLLATLPVKAASQLAKLFESGDVGVAYADTLIKFFARDTAVVSRLLEGQYPPYQRLVPASFQHQFTLNRKALIDALGRVLVIASLARGVIRLGFKGGVVTVSAEAKEAGSGAEQLDADSSDEILLAFNGDYLRQACSCFEDEDVIIFLNTPTSPVVIKGAGSPDTVLHLIMPIQLRD